MRKTLTVIGPNGTEMTILKPRTGTVCVIAKAGSTIRGTTFFQPALIDLSDNFARHLAAEGVVQIAAVVGAEG